MKSAPLPVNESERLKALDALEILDTAAESDYDNITRLAAAICGTRISLISLIDQNRQWFKSRHGLAAPETPRELAFCAHAILEPDQLFQIPDARQDERFSDNPLVTADPHVIFYAGMPLRDETGHALGTLCVIDNEPKTLSAEQQDSLQILAAQVEELFKLRKKSKQLQQAHQMLSKRQQAVDLFLRLSGDLLLEFNEQEVILRLNENWEAYLGENALSKWKGKQLADLLLPQALALVLKNKLSFDAEQELVPFQLPLQHADGKERIGEGRFFKLEQSYYLVIRDISNALRDARKLKRTLQLFEQGNKMTGLGHWEIDLRTNEIYWSEQVYHIHERDLNKLPELSEGLNYYAPGYSRERIKEVFERATKQCISYDEELEILTDKGKRRWVRTVGYPEMLGESVSRVYGTFQDITEQKNTLENYLRFVRNLPVAVVMCDTQMRYLATSDQWLKDYDLVGKEVLGKSHYTLFPDIPERWRQMHQRCLAGDKLGMDEDSFVRADGSLQWMRWQITPWYQGDGQIGGLLMMTEDITHQKQDEAAISALARMRDLLMQMATDYINLNHEEMESKIESSLKLLGEFVGADRAYIFEYDWQSYTYSNSFEWCAPEVPSVKASYQQQPMDILEDWLKSHRHGVSVEITDSSFSGVSPGIAQSLQEQQIKSLLTIPIMDHRQCLGFVGFDSVKAPKQFSSAEKNLLYVFAQIFANTKVRSALQRSLIDEKEKAELATKAKSEFLANMSHEIRTPLNGVIGFTELLLQSPLDPMQHQYAENAYTAGKNLLSIINDILDFSKIEAGKLDLEWLETPVIALLEESIDIVKYAASKKDLDLYLLAAPHMPDLFLADGLRLKQILLNLLSNAVKFTETGYVKLVAQFEPLEASMGRFTFTVSDSGIGMSEAQQQKMFQAFSQADSSTSRRFGGTGLGLSISQLLAEKMGSSIQLSSKEGEGSAFSFVIETSYSNDAAKVRPPKPNFKRVLVVDDQPGSFEVIQNCLLESAEQIEWCDNGFNAVKKLETESYDLLVIDAAMPYLDGLDAIRLIREKLKISADRMAIMLMQRVIDPGPSEEQQQSLGINMVLHKPLKPSAIKQLDMVPASAKVKDAADDAIQTGLVVLLAEDVAMNRLLFRTLFKKLVPNGKLLEAANGLEVLALLRKHQPDVVLMDVHMPELDGLEATRQIRTSADESMAQVPIVALTAGALEEEKAHCLAAGMQDFLTKPIEKDALLGLLRQFC
jgi:PAS domain S-box-containing protein